MAIKVKGKYDRPIHFYIFGWLLVFISTYVFHSMDAFFIVLFSCQLTTFILFLYLWYKSLSATRWVQTPLIKISHGCDEFNWVGSEHIDILLNYEYTFNNRSYTSSSIQYPFYYVKVDVKSKLLKNIDEGLINTVYVNPNKPNQSVLFREISIYDIYVSIAYIFSALSIMFISYFYYLQHINN